MIMFGTLTMSGGRIKGLQSALTGDEPVTNADAGGVGTKRVQTILGASGVVSCNWALYDEIRITPVGNISVAFSGSFDGQGCILTIKGGYSVTLPANVRFNSLINVYVPSVSAADTDKLGFSFDSDLVKYDLVSVVKGIA